MYRKDYAHNHRAKSTVSEKVINYPHRIVVCCSSCIRHGISVQRAQRTVSVSKRPCSLCLRSLGYTILQANQLSSSFSR